MGTMRALLLGPVLFVSLTAVGGACGGETAPTSTVTPFTPTPPTPTPASTPLPVPTPTPTAYERSLSLFDYDKQAPLGIDESSASVRDGVTVHDISYSSSKGMRVSAFLVVPDGPGPFAGVIVQHGMPGYRDDHLEYGMVLAKTGAVVLLIDAPFARRMRSNSGAQPFTFTEQDRDEQVQLIIDLRRGVDLLASRADVDADRIAYVGFSHGAAMGGLLAGVEGGPIGRLFFLPAERQDEWLRRMEEIEPIGYVGHAAPAALFFQNGRRDQAIDEDDAVRYQEAGSEPKRVEWYDSGHNLPLEAIFDHVEWLQEEIGIDAASFEAPGLAVAMPSPERFFDAFQTLSSLVRASGSTELQAKFLELTGSLLWTAPPLPRGLSDQLASVANASGELRVRDRFQELMDAPRHGRAAPFLELIDLVEASGHPALEVLHRGVVVLMLYGKQPPMRVAGEFVALAEATGSEEVVGALRATGSIT